MTAHLNGALLRKRRVEAALSVRQAATLLGVGTPVLNRIESGDTAAERAISVGSLLRLADALGCTSADLFHVASPDTTTPTDDGAVDPELLVGLLRESPTQVSIKDLAATFRTSNAAIRAAAERADERLTGTGLSVGQRHDMLFLASTRQGEVAQRLATLERTNAARTGIDNGVARVLKQVVLGQLVNGRRSTYTQSALGLLTRLGMVNSNEQGPVASEAVKYALDIT